MKPAASISCLLLVTSCAVEEIVVATSDAGPDAGHRSPHPCASNANCRPDEYCAKPNCQEPTGECSRRGAICNADLAPSCGCDNITYFNDCLRRAHGVSLSTMGECENPVQCGDGPSAPCPPPSTCAQLSCTADRARICWVLPPACVPNPPGDFYSWAPCGAAGPCVDTCTAIRSGMPHQSCP